MTLFEYISVAFSVVLSLSAAQILSNIRSVLDRDRRDWVHGLWMAHILILHVIVWWSGWALRDVSWNLASFSLALSAPALLYLTANALVPSDQSASSENTFPRQPHLVLHRAWASRVHFVLYFLHASGNIAIDTRAACRRVHHRHLRDRHHFEELSRSNRHRDPRIVGGGFS